MKPLNVALFGLGRAGTIHLENLRSLPDARLVHIVDTDEARAHEAAQACGCHASTSPETALADPGLDAIIVATPTLTHYPYIIAALEARKAVFTEKPLGKDTGEIEACFDLAEKKGLPLFVGFNRRFDPSFSDLAQRVHAGDLGQLQLLRTTSRDSPLPSIDYIRTSHGIFHDCVVHDFDLIRHIAREDPLEVYAVGSNFVPEIAEIGDLDNVLVTMKFPSGLLASIDVNRFAVYGYDQRIEAFGTGGMIQAENRFPVTTTSATEDGFSKPRIHHSFPTRYREAYRMEIETFLACVREEKPVPIARDDVMMSYVLAEEAGRSFRERKPVSLECRG